MSEALTRYLVQAYSRDVLRKRTVVEMPTNPDVIEAARAELKRINAMGLGANLAQRDFATYQRKGALEKLLRVVDGGNDASKAGTGGSSPRDASLQRGGAALRVEKRPGGDEPKAGDSDQPEGSGTEQAER